MALHSELPIYKVVYDLLALVVKLASQMPRNLRRQLGEKLIEECVELTVMIFRANVARDKVEHLGKLLERLQVAELLVRLSQDLRCISREQYGKLIELTGSIGRQATAWRKSSASAPAP
jgi:hypothetical protein